MINAMYHTFQFSSIVAKFQHLFVNKEFQLLLLLLLLLLQTTYLRAAKVNHMANQNRGNFKFFVRHLYTTHYECPFAFIHLHTEYSISIKYCKSQACNKNLSHVPILIKRQKISTCILKQISLFLSENITQSIAEVTAYSLEQRYLWSPHDLQAYSMCIDN